MLHKANYRDDSNTCQLHHTLTTQPNLSQSQTTTPFSSLCPSLPVYQLPDCTYAVSSLPVTRLNSLRHVQCPAVQHPRHGLSRRCDGSHHHKWDLLWARSPIRERHIQWQIWHSKLLVDGGPDLCRSHLNSNSWIRRTSNSSTADLHEEHQSVLSIMSLSNSEGVLPHRFNVFF